jgi:hypothetical protein
MMPIILAPRYAKAIASRYAPSGNSGFQMTGMKTVEEVRRVRLAQLRQEARSLVALNEKLGLSARDATLSQILNEAKNSRTGTPKQMGSKLAREIEVACGKEVGWMDTDPLLLDGGLLPEVASLAREITELPTAQRDWVLGVVRQTIEAAKATIRVNGNGSTLKDSASEAHHETPSPKRRRAA